MEPLDLLRHEHRQIQRVLARLLREVEQARGGGEVNPALFQRAATFLRLFVEGAHHAREHALHRAMGEHGLPLRSGLLARLAGEHAVGREQTEALVTLAREVAEGRRPSELLLSEVESYVRLHQQHSAIEEGELLPLAQRLLDGDDREKLRTRFARIEARFGPMAEAVELFEAAFPEERLTARARPPPASSSPPSSPRSP